MNRAILLLASGLAACGPLNQGVQSVHQPVVTTTALTFDLTGAAGDEQRLGEWFDRIGLGYGDTLSVEGAGDRRMVARLASARGVAVQARPAGYGLGRVTVTRAAAQVPGCPDWSRPSGPEWQASTTSNYGCALNAAMAAMVADPADLLTGRRADPNAPSNVAERAVSMHLSAQPTGAQGLKSEGTGGK
ncbi:CpaD family pilus assembly lipoprotein [Sphingomonas sp. ID0503]|uniref:CpaD family pilus assembly lipoprotein n=1 Tax=Sphingomonas sp. ID0503 TaxID=3399691 RepID=UPI003AFA4057